MLAPFCASAAAHSRLCNPLRCWCTATRRHVLAQEHATLDAVQLPSARDRQGDASCAGLPDADARRP